MRRLAGLACMLATAPAWAAQPDARWYVQLDNDVVFFTDRWYTSGARLARVQPRGDHEMEWGVLQEIYTPELATFRLNDVDRVPAGRMLAFGARHDRREGYYQTLEVGVGVRGPAALGKETTHAVHQVIAARQAEWLRQGPNRLDAQLVAVRSHGAAPFAFHYGAVVGTQIRFAHVGAEWRSRGDGAFSPVMRHAATPPPAVGAGPRWSGFVGASVRAVLRNKLLEPGYDPLAPAPERRDAVLRIAAGFGWVGGCCSVSFAVAQDSREFTTQRTPHRFGSLSVHIPF